MYIYGGDGDFEGTFYDTLHTLLCCQKLCKVKKVLDFVCVEVDKGDILHMKTKLECTGGLNYPLTNPGGVE